MWIPAEDKLPERGKLIAIRTQNFDSPTTYRYDIGVVNWTEVKPSKMGEGRYVSLCIDGQEGNDLNEYEMFLNDSEWKEIEKD